MTFNDQEAVIARVSFDGNGRHENGSSSMPYKIDENNITIEVEESNPIVIPYTMSDNNLKLGEGYLTLDEVDAGIQGYWMARYSAYSSTFELHLNINKGKMSHEKANEGFNLARGEYYYYGPYSGTYILGFGEIKGDMMNGKEWFYTIIDGKPIVLHYDTEMTATDKGFPGKNGYKFG